MLQLYLFVLKYYICLLEIYNEISSKIRFDKKNQSKTSFLFMIKIKNFEKT